MKKFCLFVLCMFSICLFFACKEVVNYQVKFDSEGGTEVASQTVEAGKQASRPSDPEKDNYTFLGWFKDEAKTTEYNFSDPVESDITVYASWEIIEEYQVAILSAEFPENMLLFEANRKEKENEKTEFFDLTKNFMVGDDNAWSCQPDMTFIRVNLVDSTFEEVDVDEWEYEITISVLENSDYTELLANSDLVDSIDTKKCTIDFATKAIGKQFKVEVFPTGLTERQSSQISTFTISFEIEVVEGYNVYDEKELSYIENRTSGEESEAWIAFKEENDLDKDYKPTALILQNNLVVTASDVPSYFFYDASELSTSDSDYERSLNSMKDNHDMFVHEFVEDEEFHIYGNYFTLDTSNFKEVTREYGEITTEGEVISHATLIRFRGSDTGVSSIENLNMVGNAPRVENTIKAGGQIFIKVEGPAFTAYNNIAACLFITYMPNYTFTPFIMEKCKAYDAFNSFVYNWGSDKVYIKDSEMIGAGGPVIIQDHVEPTAADGGKPAVTTITNSKLESYVTGSEGWFSVVGATAAVPTILMLNNLFTPFGKSFLKTYTDTGSPTTLTYMNLICVNKSGSAEGLTAEKITGSLKIDENSAFDFGETNPYFAAMLEQVFSIGAPAFQTSISTLEQGYAYTDGSTGLFDINATQIVDPTNAVYSGDYICLYYNGMALTLGYFNSNEVYTPSAE